MLWIMFLYLAQCKLFVSIAKLSGVLFWILMGVSSRGNSKSLFNVVPVDKFYLEANGIFTAKRNSWSPGMNETSVIVI